MNADGASGKEFSDINRAVDAATRVWQQGDAIRTYEAGPVLLYQAASAHPLTQSVAEITTEGDGVGGVEMIPLDPEHGFAIITQTCDIVRDSSERPMVALAQMETVDANVYASVVRGERTFLAAVPGLAAERLVANLDYVITIEKGLLVDVPEAYCVRAQGDADERSRFAEILARKLNRFAFPDDFTLSMMAIARQIKRKHGKNSDLGKALKALREIRIDVEPSWDAPEGGEVTVLFLYDRPENVPDTAEEAFEELVKKFEAHGPYLTVTVQIRSFMDLSAAAYLRSKPLDLDHLSYR